MPQYKITIVSLAAVFILLAFLLFKQQQQQQPSMGSSKWRSAGIPHAPITFRPDDQNPEDYGSQNSILYDIQRSCHYFPHLNYKDYGMYHVPGAPKMCQSTSGVGCT